MSIAAEYFPFLKGHQGAAFSGSFGVTIFLLTMAAVIAIRGERAAEREGAKKRMIPLVGMILFGIGFIGCASWYFWPSNKTEIAVENPKEELSIPISIAPLQKPGYSRYSGLYPDFGNPDNNASENDPPWIGIDDVFISNISKDMAVTLKIFLIAMDENGQVTRLEADGGGPLGNFMGRSDFSTKLYQRKGIEPGGHFILSPLSLKDQETAHGTLPFIIHPFGFTKEINTKILEYWVKHFIPTVDRIPPFKFRLEIQDVISGAKIEIPVPGKGYSGKG